MKQHKITEFLKRWPSMNLCKRDLIGIESRLKPNPLASVVPAAPQESPVFVVMSSYPISPSRRSRWRSSSSVSHEEGCPISLTRWTLWSGRVSAHRLITNWYRVSTCWPNDQIGLWNLIWGWWRGEEEGGVLVSAIRREIVFLFSILFVAPLKLTAPGVANHIADKLGWRMFACCGKPSKNILNHGKPSKNIQTVYTQWSVFWSKIDN